MSAEMAFQAVDSTVGFIQGVRRHIVMMMMMMMMMMMIIIVF